MGLHRDIIDLFIVHPFCSNHRTVRVGDYRGNVAGPRSGRLPRRSRRAAKTRLVGEGTRLPSPAFCSSSPRRGLT